MSIVSRPDQGNLKFSKCVRNALTKESLSKFLLYCFPFFRSQFLQDYNYTGLGVVPYP